MWGAFVLGSNYNMAYIYLKKTFRVVLNYKWDSLKLQSYSTYTIKQIMGEFDLNSLINTAWIWSCDILSFLL
jgi:hypothetical protein